MLFFQLCLDVSGSREGLQGEGVRSHFAEEEVICAKAGCREETWANGEIDFLLRQVALWLEVPGFGGGSSLNLFVCYCGVKYT